MSEAKTMNISVVKNLIAAVVAYGADSAWCDSDIVDALYGLGVSDDDMKACGYGEYIDNYHAAEAGDFNDDVDECGFNPYEGCYDYDC